MMEQRLDELERRVEALEENGSTIKRTRRGVLMVTGAAAFTALAGVTGIAVGSHTVEDNAPHGTALLIGTEGQRPAVDGPFFQRQVEYHYLYIATDSGARYVLETDDPSWRQITTHLKPIASDDLSNLDATRGDHVWLTDEEAPAVYSGEEWLTSGHRWV